MRGLDRRYIGKGGYKLEGAIQQLGVTVAGRVARIDFAPKWEVDANEAPHSGSR